MRWPIAGVLCGAWLVSAWAASPASAQTPVAAVPAVSKTPDAAGGEVIRATRLTTPLHVDGSLDETVYRAVTPNTAFVQGEPEYGPPATQKTELWVLFDDAAVYVTFRCWEDDLSRLVADEMRRDNFNILQNDLVGFAFDTFSDRRNGFMFFVTPIGGRLDGQVTDERQFNGDWNPVWDVATGRFDGGWTMEAAIPFKSLRYRPGREQAWRFNARREIRWKNESSFVALMPRADVPLAFNRVSAYAPLVGLEAPSQSRNVEIKPYVISDVTTDLTVTPKISNDLGADAGVDLKYGISQNLTADFTYNTDFAQVEADEQQINLTRFSLFFPEKREFFLENQGIFAFGGGGADTPTLMYSRRIGFSRGSAVPLDAGGRLTGRVGRFSLGLMNIQAGAARRVDVPATNFSALRLKTNLMRRSSVGILFTGRSRSERGPGNNQAYGLDGTFAFFDNLGVSTYWANTRTDGFTGEATSYRAEFNYAGDRYGLRADHLLVGKYFNPEVGFAQRTDIRRTSGQVRFSPRPASLESVRKLSGTGSMLYIEDTAGRVETRDLAGEFAVEFKTSDRLSVGYSDHFEFLPGPFRIASGVVIPVGGYQYRGGRIDMLFAQQRALSGTVSVEHGAFYSGHRTAIGVGHGRIEFTQRLSIEPTVSVNWVDLAQGAFTTGLVGGRTIYTMTPRMFATALVQYNSSSGAVSSNIRFRWEYAPGSELFVVYNEQRDAMTRGVPRLDQRAFVLKINRLVRF